AEELAKLDDPGLTVTTLRALLRDVAILHASAAPTMLVNADEGDRLQRLAEGPLGGRALALVQLCGEVRTAIVRRNANRLLSLDVLFDALTGPGDAAAVAPWEAGVL
ncbi:MAG: hypothetical protein MUF51_10975, partial [Vicinamibacteria bacterium]|nr:hypothetical protein [Vicinamibacteria bacterium]